MQVLGDIVQQMDGVCQGLASAIGKPEGNLHRPYKSPIS